jgi:uncharacterized membrane protein YqaE (UPF0057 family)
MILIAIIFPFLSFLLRGKILRGIICFVLQLTVLGWLPAAMWAIYSLNNDRSEKRKKEIIKAINNN